MKKSFTTTLVLLGTFVALLGWYLVYEKKLRPEHEAAEEKAKELLSLDRATITGITIERPKNLLEGGKTATEAKVEIDKVELKKTGLEWGLIAPLAYPADAPTVETMLTTATGTKTERVVDEAPKDLEPYGLKTPLVKVTLYQNEKASEILVGIDTPTGASAYVKTSSSPKIYRAPKVVRTAFEKSLKDLRNKEILKVGRATISEVEFSGKESFLVKKSSDNWLLAREGLNADATEWHKTLNALLDAKAQDFASDKASDAGKFGLASPVEKVTFSSVSDKKKSTLLLGKVGDKTYAKLEDQPTIFVVDKDVLAKAQQPSSTYLDRHLAQFNRFDASRVVITRGGELLELTKGEKDTDWKFAGDDKTKLDKAKVDTLLTNLQDMKIASFKKGAAAIANPVLTVQVFEKKDKPDAPKVSLKFAKAEGAQVAGESKTINTGFSIAAADFKKLNLGKADVTQKESKESGSKAPGAKPENKSAEKAPDKGKG